MLARATPTFKHCIIFSILFSLEFHIKKLLNTHLNAEGHDACVIFSLVVGEQYTPLGLTLLHFAN